MIEINSAAYPRQWNRSLSWSNNDLRNDLRDWKMIRTIWPAAVGLAVLGAVAVKRVTNPVFELSISLKSLSVGKGEDLHHDHAGELHRRVDPIIRI
jgi:hypothetical protein